MKARVCVWVGLKVSCLFFLASFTTISAQDAKKPASVTDKPIVSPSPVQPTPKKDLPPARDIIDRFVKEIGGAEAFSKHKSEHATGSVEMPAQQMKGTLEVYAASPNKMLLKINLQGVGEVTTGYDGKVGYMLNPLTGPMLMQGKMLAQVAKQADYNHILHEPQDFKSIETIDLLIFEGEECYKIKTVDNTDVESTEYYSKKTGLQRGYSTTQESPFGSVPVVSVVNTYSKFGDLLLPSVVTEKMLGMEQVMTMREMEFDTVKPEVFALPKEIEALLKK